MAVVLLIVASHPWIFKAVLDGQNGLRIEVLAIMLAPMIVIPKIAVEGMIKVAERFLDIPDDNRNGNGGEVRVE